MRSGIWTAVGIVLIVVGGLALPAAATHSTAVDVVDNDFEPETIYVREGSTVDWTHKGSNDHTVTADDGSFDSHPDCESTSDCMENGDTFSEEFTSTGTYPYYCKLHGSPGGGGMSGVVEVVSSDAEPTVSINDRSATEGDSGTTTMTFTVSLSFDPDETVTVDYETNDDTATAGSDYTATSGTLTFDPGEQAQTLDVTVHGDTEIEDDETFTVDLSNAQNAPIDGGQGVGTINNDDAEPTVSINDRSATEGDSGTTTMTFTVSLSFDPDETVMVDYETNDDTATAGSDYTATSGTLTFDPGEQAQTLDVTVHGDTEIEDDETFTVDLNNAQNATIDDGQGVGTINDDDDPEANQPPIADAGGPYAAVEGDSVTLDGSGSSDPDGSITSYEWDLDGDGTVDATDATPTTSYGDDGTVQVILTVTDADGRSDSDTATVDVSDTAAVSRSSGSGRIATAVDVSSDHWNQADVAILATAVDFPDALAAGPLAAKQDAPLLLTPSDQLPTEVEDELERLGASKVWLLGGTAAISQGVEDRLDDLGYDTQRLAGTSRFGTARAIALEVGASPTDHAVVALGQHADPSRDSWPDALAAGSLSASPDRLPTLLTVSDSLPADTEHALAQLDVSKVFLLGGTAAVSDDVRDRLVELGYQVERLAGSSRYGTGVAVATDALGRHADGDVPIVFATGANFPDGLTAGALAARLDALVVLVPADFVPGEVETFLQGDATRFDVGVVVGGELVVSEQTRTDLEADIRA